MSSTETLDAGTEAESAATQGSIDEVREAILAQLVAELGDAVVGSHIAAGVDITVRVDSQAWATTAEFVKHKMGFEYFNFLSAIDWLPSPFGRDMDSQVDVTLAESSSGTNETASGVTDADPETMQQGLAGGDTRFQVLARVNDVVNHRALTLKTDVDDNSLSLPSWVPSYAGADWHEREAWEMFGINFIGHPGLRHIYLPGSFEGNPLRKDYPLLARRVKPWPGIVDVELMPTEEEADTSQAVEETSKGKGEGGKSEQAEVGEGEQAEVGKSEQAEVDEQ